MTCTAIKHGTYYCRYKFGCRCPASLEDARRLRYGLGVDPVAAMRVVAGDKVRLSPGERRLVVAELTRRQVSAKQIAKRMNLTPRSVTRIRARLRDQQAA